MLVLLVPTHSLRTSISLRFDVVNHLFELHSYQLYAVEKWLVDRSKLVLTLAVYTGDPLHKINVSALSPSSVLSQQDAAAEWDRALHYLRRDGARPRQTPHGVIMTTSLAHFRSDFTIVHIPDGNFPKARQQLYANINLLRMGCSGRSALCLDDPSDTTKERFLTTYHLPEPIPTATPMPTPAKFKSHAKSKSLDPSKLKYDSLDSSRYSSQNHSFVSPIDTAVLTRTSPKTLFNATVIELVSLLQAALAVFGLFPATPYAGSGNIQEIDGLLCDITVEGIQRWVAEIGEPTLGVEPMERVADPTVVSALLSLVLATRNKLAAIGYAHVVPKDPFLHPYAFAAALAVYVQSTPLAFPITVFPAQTSFIPHHSRLHSHMPAPISHTSSSSSASASASASVSTFFRHPTAILTRALLHAIGSAYDRVRHIESRRVHRVLLNKLDDLRVGGEGDDLDSGLLGGSSPDGDGGGGGVGSGVGSGQILSGIGSLASGLGLGGGGGGGSGSGGAGAVLEGIMDLAVLARFVVEWKGKGKGKSREGEGEWEERWRDGVKDRSGDGVPVAGSLRALWSGRVEDLVRVRERERERAALFSGVARIGHDKTKADKDREHLALSDGDVEEVMREREKTEGKSTEEESEPVMGSGRPWSGKMQRKIGAWAGLSRRKHTVDMSGSSGKLTSSPPEASFSPILPAVVVPKYNNNKDRDPGEEEDLLSSGQVSPISEVKISARSILSEGQSSDGGSTKNLSLSAASDYERKLTAFNQNRPPGKSAYQGRVPTWADPVSAKRISLDVDRENEAVVGTNEVRKRVRRGDRRPSILGVMEEGVEKEVEVGQEADADVGVGVGVENEEGRFRRRRPMHNTKRRRSFHDLESLREMRVLTAERMQIDVELCGQLLVMHRRDSHLEYMLACLQALTTALSDTNASLREDYHSHQQALLDLESRTKVIAQIEAQRIKADMATQETNTLLYESAQFRVRDLWDTAGPPRQKVFGLREKVFGTGGRRLPRGAHGAHGRFNRLQWMLDERERLVDWMGRTESEVEEEEGVVDGVVEADVTPEEDEEDVVEHPAIKPVWLLRFFETWGVRWRTTKQEDEKAKNGDRTPMSPERVSET